MRPHLLLLLIFVGFVGQAFSFSLQDYMNANENASLASYKNFTMDGDNYSIITINNSEELLLKNDAIVQDEEEIKETLNKYFIKEYYPLPSEIDEIKALIAQYNESRNDGFGNYKGKEEYVCRACIFTDKRIDVTINGVKQKLWCHDDESCKMNALLLFSYGVEQFHWPSYETLLQPLKDFSYSSYGTDEILANYSERLESLNKDNVWDTISYMKNTIPVLKDYADKMEASIFRSPRMNDSADVAACKNKCYGLCPPLEIDQEGSLAKLKSKVDALYTKVAPLGNLDSITTKIINGTKKRLTIYENKKKMESYNKIFNPLEERGKALEKNATQAYLLIADTSLNIKKEEAIALRESIRNRIDTQNFTGLDEDIASYESAIESLENKTTAVFSLYDEIKEAKGAAIANIFEIGSYDLLGDEQKKYEEYIAQLQQIDDEMVSGITPDKAKEIRGKYQDLANATAELKIQAENSPVEVTTSPLKTLAIKTNGWLAYAASTTQVATANTLIENKMTALGGFTVLLFFSLLAIAFLAIFALYRPHLSLKGRYLIIGSFAIAFILITAFCGALFFYMDKTSSDATFKDFYDELAKQKTVAITVDEQTASVTQGRLMKECADKISKTLTERGMTADVIIKNGETCTKDNQTIDCNAADHYGASIELSMSEKYEEPTFSTAFLVKARIKEPVEYYETCPIAEMVK